MHEDTCVQEVKVIYLPLSNAAVSRRPSSYMHFSNISSETTGPIKVIFPVDLPWDRGMKVCSNDLGHMTKMAAMPTYGRNIKKVSSLKLGIRYQALKYG